LAVSFPAGDGGKFDAGVTGSFSGIVHSDDPDLGGIIAGVTVGVNKGSVSDISKPSTKAEAAIPFGKKLSNKAIDLAAKHAKGALKGFLNGPARKLANSALGLSATVGVKMDRDTNEVQGASVGISKGVGILGKSDALTTVCSIREGCRGQIAGRP
jgi:hypothetical protein